MLFSQLLLLLYLEKNVKVIPVCFWIITKEKNIEETATWYTAFLFPFHKWSLALLFN